MLTTNAKIIQFCTSNYNNYVLLW